MTPVIMDIAIGLILLAFVLLGMRRGMFRTLVGLVIFVVALVGAGIAARTLAEPAARLVLPVLEERIVQRVEAALDAEPVEQTQTAEEEIPVFAQLQELLDKLGLDEKTRQSLTEKAEDKIENTGATIAAAVAEELAVSLLYGIIYLLAFLLLMLVLHLLARGMDLFLKLPVLHGLNTLGGAVIGLLEGALVVYLVIWIAPLLGHYFPPELVAKTHILHFFMTYTPFEVLSLF